MIAFLINPEAGVLHKLEKADAIFPRRRGDAEKCRCKDSGGHVTEVAVDGRAY